jgi:hypothetical protein
METKLTIQITAVPDWGAYISESFKRLRDVFENMARRFLNASQALSPADTGYMRSQHSSFTEDALDDPRMQAIAAVVKVDTDYAYWVYYGHDTPKGRHLDGRPWVEDAINPLGEMMRRMILAAFLDTRVKYISTPGGEVYKSFGIPTKGRLTAGF